MKKSMEMGLFLMALFMLTSCTNILDKPLNKEDYDKVKETIQNDNDYSPMQKKYIFDNLSMQLGFIELAKAMNADDKLIPTFRTQIDDLVADYDSIMTAKIAIKENNKKLENFISLKDANTTSLDKYTGILSMTLDFNNQFDKEILYIILNYKYVNKYDSEFFDERSKLTDEVAGDFRGEVAISTREEYNSVANFMWSEVPVRAGKELRDKLGVEEADKKVKKDFLMEGLQVSALGIVFKDKSELLYQNADWEYFDE